METRVTVVAHHPTSNLAGSIPSREWRIIARGESNIIPIVPRDPPIFRFSRESFKLSSNYHKFHQPLLLSSKLTRVVLIFHAFPLPSAPSANLSCTCPITDLLLSLKTSNMSRTVEIFVFSTRSANLSIFPRIVSIQIIVQLSQVSPTSFPFFEINTRYINFPCISSSVNTFCKYYPVLVLSLISC